VFREIRLGEAERKSCTTLNCKHVCPPDDASQFAALNISHLVGTGGVYDPASSGAVSSLSYAYDFQTIQALSAPSDEIGVGLLVKQGHDYYVADYGGVGQNGWNHLTGILQASDFMHLMGAGPKTPDFTTQGSPLEIGYFTAHTCEGWQWLTWGLANFQVTINGTSFTDNRFRQTDWTGPSSTIFYDPIRNAYYSSSNCPTEFLRMTRLDGCSHCSSQRRFRCVFRSGVASEAFLG
jgi:hypothetical protein